jgi:phthiocerol/phenolphthiocerol synthesis type-I polyketide synthase A
MKADAHDASQLRQRLIDYLITTIGCNPDDVVTDLPLNSLGVGSRDAVVLSGGLSELVGRPISPVEFWEHPTINTLADFLTVSTSESDAVAEPPADRGSLDEPIAVIGVGCRFPGGIHGPDSLWRFLSDRDSAVREVPPDRWQAFDDGSPEMAAALARTSRWGGFLDEIDAFDAEFFDISPSEAAKMDPQQRLLLEVACEALEHAGIPADSLRRTRTGVFAGACVSEYGYLASRDLSRVDAWTGTGCALSIIANRLSYFLDLRGPSVAVDTACSSSLVAVHLACQSLRAGDSDLAISAGVNLLLSPAITRSLDEADAMSPSGRCHAFDARADGYVRGEGCGVVVLKRLTDALRDGDRVLAVVRGSAVNQDGRSNGLMAPNPAAQVAVLRAACANAGVEVGQIDYVEAHGTGTLLGDPIEARALGTVFGRARPDGNPLLIGSIKTNLGHLEAAAGIAGFIKAALALQHSQIPPSLHFDAPNPHIPFDELRMKVVAERTDWPSTGRPRRAGVSSFGFGGTNAHVVLEQGPGSGSAPTGHRVSAATTLVVSGKTPDRVASLAGALADWMADTGANMPLPDIAHTLNHHRSRHARFATVCALDRAQAVAGLRAVAQGRAAEGVVGPHDGTCGPGTVFVYAGQGSQWAGMGRQLLADESAFAAAVAELEPIFVATTGFSLQAALAEGEPVLGIERIQPLLVGLQLALTALWRSYGVEPDAVIGHSMGEVTAAVVAGALSPADGLRVIATRSQLMSRLSGRGAMALLELGPDAAEAIIAGHPEVTLAVYASPRQSVIAGPPDHVRRVISAVQARDRLARLIDVDVASHHPIIDPVLPQLRSALADLVPAMPTIPVITTTHEPTRIPTFDADYWAANLRNPVRFSEAVAAAGGNFTTFVEVSPHPLLTHAITETLTERHHHVVATLNRDTHDTLTFHTNLNATHTTRAPLTDHPPEPHPPIPTTPWRHTRHWIPPKTMGVGSAPKAGTLLGPHTSVSSTPPVHLWQARLVPEAKPYPGRHRIRGVDVVPASVLLHTMLTAAADLGDLELSDIRFTHPIVIDQERAIQVLADDESISVASSSTSGAPAQRWVRHVTARFSPASAGGNDAPMLRDLESAAVPRSAVAELVEKWGIEGPPFHWSIHSCDRTSTGLAAEVRLDEPSTVALVDAAMHLAPLVGSERSQLCVPAAVEHMRLEHPICEPRGSVSIRRVGGNGDEIVVDITITAADGSSCVSIRSLRYIALDSAPAAVETDPTTFAHAIEWCPRTDIVDGFAAGNGFGTVAVVGEEADELRTRLNSAGYGPAQLTDARYVVYVADAHSAAGVDIDPAMRMCTEITNLVRLLAQRPEQNPVSLWILTRGVHEAVHPAALRHSCLWGLAGVIAAEHSELWGGLVDLEGEPSDSAQALTTVLATPAKSILVLRDGVFLSPMLAPVTGERVRGPVRCRPDGAYLVTGGRGALGLLMAAWLAECGARRVVLAGRTPLPARRDWNRDHIDGAVREKIDAIRALEMRGVSIELVALDVGSPEEVQALLAERDRRGAPPIRGVVHAAGVTDSQLLTNVTDDRLRQTMWPKVSGGQALDRAFPPGSVDFLFLVSSAATVFGVPGQGAYAAANAYLDALARARHARGCHSLSLDWVAWRGLGFAANAQIVAEELRLLGSRPITPPEAFAAWEHVSAHDMAQAVIAPMPSASADGRPRDVRAQRAWFQMPVGEIRDELENGIRAILAEELRIDAEELEPDVPFAELGLNSMMALAVRREAERLVGIELSATMLWNHPTIASLAEYLAKKLARQDQSQSDATCPASTSSVLDALFDSIESGSR